MRNSTQTMIQTRFSWRMIENRPMKEYASPNLYNFAPEILQPTFEGNGRFEIKPVMLQMLQAAGQFGGATGEDPHAHLMSFLEICSAFPMAGVPQDSIRQTLFPFSLKDEARQWAYSFEPGEITTWSQMVEKFMHKYFPPTVSAKRRRDIVTFEQKDSETLSEAWARFKRLVRNCPHNGIPDCVQMEIFYGGLNKTSQSVADASAAGGLMGKTYTQAKEILEEFRGTPMNGWMMGMNPGTWIRDERKLE